MSDTFQLGVALFLSFLSGVFGSWFVAKFAPHLGLIDRPSQRSSHAVPTPKGGGIGILVAFSGLAWWYGVDPAVWSPVVPLALLSLAGDRIELSPLLRLGMQFFAAGIILIHLGLSWWILAVAAVFIVGSANFYNFMDGINGIAAITAIVGFFLLGWWGTKLGSGPSWVPALSYGIAAACLGFLPFNFPRAKVFMGDVGSILLGFVFAVFVVRCTNSFPVFCLFVSFLFPFYADELVCMAERIWRRESLVQPHRTHLYQVLANEYNLPHWKVSLAYGGWQIFVGLGAVQSLQAGFVFLCMWLLACFGVFILVNFFVKRSLAVRSSVDGAKP